MSLTIPEIQKELLKQVGPSSPLKVICDEDQKVTWEDLEVKWDWQLLGRVLCDSQDSFSEVEKNVMFKG